MAEVDLAELERYLRIFQENPDSRVFAPLADLYRRLGRLQEAEEICREGMQRHPYYAGGRVALANILLDSGRLPEALSEAENVVTYYPDNLLARKILIRVLGGQGEIERARREFEALKHLAPAVSSDPELERALQGPSRVESLSAHPGVGSAEPADEPPMSQYLHTKGQLRELHLNAHPDEDLARRQARRLKGLLRKKLILETWLRMLGSSPSLR